MLRSLGTRMTGGHMSGNYAIAVGLSRMQHERRIVGTSAGLPTYLSVHDRFSESSTDEPARSLSLREEKVQPMTSSTTITKKCVLRRSISLCYGTRYSIVVKHERSAAMIPASFEEIYVFWRQQCPFSQTQKLRQAGFCKRTTPSGSSRVLSSLGIVWSHRNASRRQYWLSKPFESLIVI